MKKYLLIIYIFSFAHIVSAQSTTSRTLFWVDKDTSVLAKNVSYSYPFFTGCSFDNVQKLPVFGETFYTNAEVYLNEHTSEVIPAAEAKKLDGVNVPPEYIFKVTSGYDRGSATKRIMLYPIRRNTNGSFERITSFSLRYTSTTNSSYQNIQNATGGRLTKAYQNSVLGNGRWVKLRISKTGVHKISPTSLNKWGFSNINQVSIWGNGCGELPRSNDEAVDDDLFQLPTSIYNGNLIFYAEAKNLWSYNSSKDFFEHAQNEYSPYSYVFITDSRPVKNVSGISSESNPNYSTRTYDYRDYYEKVDTNFLKSGRRFFSNILDVVSQITIGLTIPEANTSSPLKLQVCAAAQSNSSSTFSISVNNGVENLLPIRGLSSGNFAMVDTALFSNITYGSPNVNVRVAYNKPSTAAWGVLDFITLNARANLSLKNNQLLFRDVQSIGVGKITNFAISTSRRNVKVWDVTDIHNVQEPSLTTSGDNISFSLSTNTLREFIAFNETMLFEPELIGSISNQNLHGLNRNPDYLIVTCPDFWEKANELASLHSDLDTWVVTTEQVYNEFSSGIPDPTAIRNFAKMLYHRGGNLKYLLLFGNGSYVNYEGKKGASLVPTYQSGISLTSDNTFVSDDYFG
ncbi:MAG: C25 family cysteine peptidase, partial [Prevotellaceae bacterium]|nr:C25 family cysteine peptidase [Prevotellaceae bacterium]